MRLVGLGVIAMLLFAFVALLVDDDTAVLQNVGFDIDIGEDVIVLETLDAPMPASLQTHTNFPIVEFDQWTALAGFSSQQQLVLPLPRATTFDSAVVHIDLKAELGPQTNGRLRFTINETDRGEVVLEPGTQAMTVKIPLSPIEREQDQVSINITSVGTAPKAECTDNWTGGIVVKIEPTTHIAVHLTEDLTAIEDRLLASGSPARVIWQGATKASESPSDYLLPWQWQPFLVKGIFVDQSAARDTDVALSLEQLTDYRKTQMARLHLVQKLEGDSSSNWPVDLAEAFADKRSRNFRNQTSWTYRYVQSDLPLGNLPDTLRLKLLAQSSVEENGWLVVVKLNGNILLSEAFPHSLELFDKTIHLPISSQSLENELVITLSSDEKKEGHCVQGVPAVAQLAEGTELNWHGANSDPLYAGLLSAATPEVDLYVAQTLSAEEANFGFYTISDVFRTSTFNLVPFEGGTRTEGAGIIMMLDQDGYNEAIQRIGDRIDQFWVAYTVIDRRPEPDIHAFKGDDPLVVDALEVHEPKSILLIGPPDFKL